MIHSYLGKYQSRESAGIESMVRDGWHKHGLLVVSPDDARLDWMERQLIRNIAEKLHGKRLIAQTERER
jgi:hypothetical protein